MSVAVSEPSSTNLQRVVKLRQHLPYYGVGGNNKNNENESAVGDGGKTTTPSNTSHLTADPSSANTTDASSNNKSKNKVNNSAFSASFEGNSVYPSPLPPQQPSSSNVRPNSKDDISNLSHASSLSHPAARLFVGDIRYVNKDDLEATFSPFGPLKEIWAHNSQGFAFVEYFEREHAVRALEKLHGSVVKGDKLRVEFSKSRNSNKLGGTSQNYYRTGPQYSNNNAYNNGTNKRYNNTRYASYNASDPYNTINTNNNNTNYFCPPTYNPSNNVYGVSISGGGINYNKYLSRDYSGSGSLMMDPSYYNDLRESERRQEITLYHQHHNNNAAPFYGPNGVMINNLKDASSYDYPMIPASATASIASRFTTNAFLKKGTTAVNGNLGKPSQFPYPPPSPFMPVPYDNSGYHKTYQSEIPPPYYPSHQSYPTNYSYQDQLLENEAGGTVRQHQPPANYNIDPHSNYAYVGPHNFGAVRHYGYHHGPYHPVTSSSSLSSPSHDPNYSALKKSSCKYEDKSNNTPPDQNNNKVDSTATRRVNQQNHSALPSTTTSSSSLSNNKQYPLSEVDAPCGPNSSSTGASDYEKFLAESAERNRYRRMMSYEKLSHFSFDDMALLQQQQPTNYGHPHNQPPHPYYQQHPQYNYGAPVHQPQRGLSYLPMAPSPVPYPPTIIDNNPSMGSMTPSSHYQPPPNLINPTPYHAPNHYQPLHPVPPPPPFDLRVVGKNEYSHLDMDKPLPRSLDKYQLATNHNKKRNFADNNINYNDNRSYSPNKPYQHQGPLRNEYRGQEYPPHSPIIYPKDTFIAVKNKGYRAPNPSINPSWSTVNYRKYSDSSSRDDTYLPNYPNNSSVNSIYKSPKKLGGGDTPVVSTTFNYNRTFEGMSLNDPDRNNLESYGGKNYSVHNKGGVGGEGYNSRFYNGYEAPSYPDAAPYPNNNQYAAMSTNKDNNSRFYGYSKNNNPNFFLNDNRKNSSDPFNPKSQGFNNKPSPSNNYSNKEYSKYPQNYNVPQKQAGILSHKNIDGNNLIVKKIASDSSNHKPDSTSATAFSVASNNASSK